MTPCGPYVCRFPSPSNHKAGDRWRCPECATLYRLSRPKPARWWRNWSAVAGHWRVPLLHR